MTKRRSGRADGRRANQTRPLTITTGYLEYAEGSALIELGATRLICSATVEDKIPPWMRSQKVAGGWVTAEYAMLPRSTPERIVREAVRGRLGGRTQEIQRLIGRALRAVVDLKALGDRTIWCDCYVIQADAGTRTAAITGAFVALALAGDEDVVGRVAVSAAGSVLLLVARGRGNHHVVDVQVCARFYDFGDKTVDRKGMILMVGRPQFDGTCRQDDLRRRSIDHLDGARGRV